MTRSKQSAALLVLAACSLAGCSSPFIKKDLVEKTEWVALAQYALNPGELRGTPQIEEVRQQSAEANAQLFLDMMKDPFTFLSLDAMSTNVGYQSRGRAKLKGYVYTPAGLRFLLEGRDNERAEMHPIMVEKVCEDLRVDGIFSVAERWSVSFYNEGYRARLHTTVTVNLYDEHGKHIWRGVASGASEEGMGALDGVISTDPLTLVLNGKQALSAALTHLKTKLSRRR